MENNEWKNFFLFTRKERIAVICLAGVIIISTIVPAVLPKESVSSSASGEEFQKELEQVAEALQKKKDQPFEQKHSTVSRGESVSSYPDKGYPLFSFDPNTVSAADWKKLGISDRTVTTIQRYIAKGGRFRKPEDIRKIYGIRSKDLDRLLPYVTIEAMEKRDIVSYNKKSFETTNSVTREKRDSYRTTFNINTADTALLIALPGIGSKLAQRIINFREKLGGFYTVNQVAETFGLPDSAFQKIKERIICNESEVRTLNINTASAEQLKQHPYIKWNLANAIVAYRFQHGLFRSTEELQKIGIINSGQLIKLLPYLRVE